MNFHIPWSWLFLIYLIQVHYRTSQLFFGDTRHLISPSLTSVRVTLRASVNPLIPPINLSSISHLQIPSSLEKVRYYHKHYFQTLSNSKVRTRIETLEMACSKDNGFACFNREVKEIKMFVWPYLKVTLESSKLRSCDSYFPTYSARSPKPRSQFCNKEIPQP